MRRRHEALAVHDGIVQSRSYPAARRLELARGWEYVESLAWAGGAARRRRGRSRCSAPTSARPGTTTIVLDSEQTQLQMHESVGHPTELDRILGTEAAYAGTSWVGAGDLGSLRYGSDLMNVTADATTPGGLGTFGWDDEGMPAQARADRRRPACSSAT